MNWEAAGAVGEILGAATVIVTLLYVAVQTKQTRVAVQHAGNIGTNEAHSRVRLTLSQNPELAAILAKANVGGDLTEAERIQLSNLCMDRFIASAIGEITATPGSTRAETEYLVEFLHENPGTVQEWRRQRHLTRTLAPKLTAEIDQWLAKLENASDS